MEPRTNKSRHLRYPVRAPLSRFKVWSLPREWQIPKPSTRLKLPGDPVDMLSGLSESSANESQMTSSDQVRFEGEQIKQSDLIEFAIQTWRLEKRADGLDPDKFKRERKQVMDSARQFAKFLSRFDVSYRDPAGLPFDTGMLDIEVISWDDPEDEQAPEGVAGPWIKQTVFPIVYKGERIIKRGEVVCVDPEE